MKGMSAAYGLIGAMLAGTALGYGFDRLFGTSPVGLILGSLFGFAAGLYGIYQALMKP